MKYYKDRSFSKSVGKTGFYTLVVCCLLAIGAATWFAVSKSKSPSNDSNIESNIQNTPSYSDNTSSYNNSDLPSVSEPDTPAANEVSDVPYTEPQQDSEKAPEEKRSFVMPVEGNVSKGYSETALQYSETYGDMRLHTGIDIVCEAGTEVRSAGSGTVSSVENDALYGKTVTVEHGDGIIAKYCGLDGIFVKVGDTLSAGNSIGTVGTVPCECAEQSHIHIFAEINGETVSPLKAFSLE